MNLGLYGRLILFVFNLGCLPRRPRRYRRLYLFFLLPFPLFSLLLFLLFRRYVLERLLKVRCGVEYSLDFGLIDHRLNMAKEVGELRTQRGIDRDCGSSLNVSRNDHVRKGDPVPNEEGAFRKMRVKSPECMKLGISKTGVNLGKAFN